MAIATTDSVCLPPAVRAPKSLQGVAFLLTRRPVVAAMGRRYGSEFTLDLPLLGQTVVISDPTLVKDLFSTNRDLLGRVRLGLGDVLGEGSMFNLDGDELLRRRRLLAPPFHGKHMAHYVHVVEEEVMRETAAWPEGQEFETAPSMLRITLNVILRAVFGAEGAALDELHALLPPAVTLGGRIGMLPPIVRRDLGAWSPGARLREHRRRVDAVIHAIIAEARADPAFAERKDMLAILLQARYDDGEPMSDRHICDELLTLLVAGHETTSASLCWMVERIRRHPQLLARLADEVDAGGSELRQATLWEVLRTRPILDGAMRRAKERIRLGPWVIPEGATVMASIQLAHNNSQNFPDPESFNPDRFIGAPPSPVTWIPFGGGINRCIGASFANMEMDVVLRTLLREFRFEPTSARDERQHNRGVAFVPGRGARALVYRRDRSSSSSSASRQSGPASQDGEGVTRQRGRVTTVDR